MAEVSELYEAAQKALAKTVWSLELPIGSSRTHQRAYFEYNDRFLKRSLGPHEQVRDTNTGIMITSARIPAQLENEAAALHFIKLHTDIPVPKVLAAYNENDVYFLWTERINGTTMKQLTSSEKNIVMHEIERHVTTLQNLRSRQAGGHNGFASLPNWLRYELPQDLEPLPIASTTEDFVFCHMDLGQNNIIVDPVTLKVNAIIDWEFAGFYPSHFEGHYYQTSFSSGQQYRMKIDVPKVVEFFTTAKPRMFQR